MFSLLLDQHLSIEIAEQLRAKRPDIPIVSLYEWREGSFIGAADHIILQAAAEAGITLVTYDRRTIPAVLVEWGACNIAHGGVIFVDNLSIKSNEYGRLIRALIYYWDKEQQNDWTNRIGFLPGIQ